MDYAFDLPNYNDVQEEEDKPNPWIFVETKLNVLL